MHGHMVSAKVWRGLAMAAQVIGEKTDAYRPTDTSNPLQPTNHYLRLPAAFNRPRGRIMHAGGYGETLWEGVFDATHTQSGDYLVHADGGTWFIAERLPMQAPLCVRTLRRLSFARLSRPGNAGANGYGGGTSGRASAVLTSWPAAMVTTDAKGQIELTTTTALKQAVWAVLLPPLEWLGLLPGDTMADDLGRAGVVEIVEFTELGWRLAVRQSTA